MTLEQATANVEASLPGWAWLVRTDEREGYMAIIHSPDTRTKSGVVRADLCIEGQTTFARYGAEPAKCLAECVAAALSANTP